MISLNIQGVLVSSSVGSARRSFLFIGAAGYLSHARLHGIQDRLVLDSKSQ